MELEKPQRTVPGRLTPFRDYVVSRLGLSEMTAWRMAKRGWFKTVKIANRVYVDEEEIARFEERAKRGEFATKKGRNDGDG